MEQFRQVLTSSVDAILCGGMDEVDETVEEAQVDAILLDLDEIASTMSEATERLKEVRNRYPDIVIVALTRSDARAERLNAKGQAPMSSMLNKGPTPPWITNC